MRGGHGYEGRYTLSLPSSLSVASGLLGWERRTHSTSTHSRSTVRPTFLTLVYLYTLKVVHTTYTKDFPYNRGLLPSLTSAIPSFQGAGKYINDVIIFEY